MIKEMVNSVILILCFCLKVSGLTIQFSKINIVVPYGSYYLFHVSVSRSNLQLLSSKIQSDMSISNSVPTIGNYFDYFYYMQPQDVLCYQNAIQQNEFLFPCPFITNNYAVNRITNLTNSVIINNTPVNLLNNANFSFVIDNTPYPFPIGAFPVSYLSLQTNLKLKINFSDTYKVIGIRLACINATVLILFIIFIGKMVYDERKMQKSMQGDSVNINDFPIPQGNDSDASSDQNYDDILKGPQISKRSLTLSKESSILNSLITSQQNQSYPRYSAEEQSEV